MYTRMAGEASQVDEVMSQTHTDEVKDERPTLVEARNYMCQTRAHIAHLNPLGMKWLALASTAILAYTKWASILRGLPSPATHPREQSTTSVMVTISIMRLRLGIIPG